LIRTVAGKAADVAELANWPAEPKGEAFAVGQIFDLRRGSAGWQPAAFRGRHGQRGATRPPDEKMTVSPSALRLLSLPA
jgi:hypothetical protein